MLSELPTSEIRIPSSRGLWTEPKCRTRFIVDQILGNRRAFVQFDQVDDAITFMKEHFPTLLVQLEHSTDDVPDGTFVTQVHYARSRDNDGNGSQTNSGNWPCPSVRGLGSILHQSLVLADDLQCDFSNYATRNVCRKCGAAPSGKTLRSQSSIVVSANRSLQHRTREKA